MFYLHILQTQGFQIENRFAEKKGIFLLVKIKQVIFPNRDKKSKNPKKVCNIQILVVDRCDLYTEYPVIVDQCASLYRIRSGLRNVKHISVCVQNNSSDSQPLSIDRVKNFSPELISVRVNGNFRSNQRSGTIIAKESPISPPLFLIVLARVSLIAKKISLFISLLH